MLMCAPVVYFHCWIVEYLAIYKLYQSTFWLFSGFGIESNDGMDGLVNPRVSKQVYFIYTPYFIYPKMYFLKIFLIF